MFVGELRPYQVEAVDRAVDRLRLLVAHSLGTGKTIVGIAAVERLMEDPESGVYQGLVLCPGSLRWQWRDQIRKFTDVTTSSGVLVVDGAPTRRQSIYEKFSNDQGRYLILSYDTLMRDFGTVAALPADFVIFDEASYVKNFRAKRSRAAKALTAPVRIALTGTPVENARLEEFHSVMEAVDHTVLGRWPDFERRYIVRDTFGGVKHYLNIPEFVKRMEPAMARKRAEDPDVARYLPKVSHDTLPVPMDPRTASVYRDITPQITDLCTDLAQYPHSHQKYNLAFEDHPPTVDGMDRRALKIMSEIGVRLTYLRLLTTDPELVGLSDSDWIKQQYIPNLPQTKRVELVNTVKDVLETDPRSKIVVFTSFRKMLPLLVGSLVNTGDVASLHGQMPGPERAENIDRFRNDPRCRVFVSTDAGGFGLDLPEANYLVNYDLPWSSGKWTQRNGRIVRASSLWPTVQRWDLVMDSSIDGYIRQVLLSKARAVDVLVDGQEVSTNEVSFSPDSLHRYLKGT